MDRTTLKILIERCRSGGASLAAPLVRVGFRSQIGLMDRIHYHYDQPLWTLVGAGNFFKSSLEQKEASMIHCGVEWVKDCVRTFRPNSTQLQTAESEVMEFENIIFSTGIEFYLDKPDGEEGNPSKNGLISVYQNDQIYSATKTIQEFRGGVAIFTLPPVPIRCAGTPHKILHLTYEFWRQSFVLVNASSMSAHRLARESVLPSEEEGRKCFLNFGKYSLHLKKFSKFFVIGEGKGIPKSKTGATIHKQAPVVAKNALRFLKNEQMDPAYHGYSSCSLVPRIVRLVFAKFGYAGKVLPSFSLDPINERRIYWVPKKDFLPSTYWHGILKDCL